MAGGRGSRRRALLAGPALSLRLAPLAGRVAVARCQNLWPELVPNMEKMFDQWAAWVGW